MVAILVGALAMLNALGSETVLTSVYQPLFLSEGEDVVPDPVVCRVPFVTVTSAGFENCVTAITLPHPPLKEPYAKKVIEDFGGGGEGDVNAASQAGISLGCTLVARGKYEVTWDFSNAKQTHTTATLIRAIMECLDRTGGERVVFFSKFIEADGYPELRKIIREKYPVKPVKN